MNKQNQGTPSEENGIMWEKFPNWGGGRVWLKSTPYFSLFFPIQGLIKWQKTKVKKCENSQTWGSGRGSATWEFFPHNPFFSDHDPNLNLKICDGRALYFRKEWTSGDVVQFSKHIRYMRRSNPRCPCHIEVQRASGIWGSNEISPQVIHSIIVPYFKEFLFRRHCSIEVATRIKNLGV